MNPLEEAQRDVDLRALKDALAIAVRRYKDELNTIWLSLEDEIETCIHVLSRRNGP